MTRKNTGPRTALFEQYEKPVCSEAQQVFDLMAETAAKLDRVKNPLRRSLTEFELQELADILRRGASPSVEFEPDLALMAMKAAEFSKLACRAALEMLEPHLEAIKNAT
jgi:hypothetical protein